MVAKFTVLATVTNSYPSSPTVLVYELHEAKRLICYMLVVVLCAS